MNKKEEFEIHILARLVVNKWRLVCFFVLFGVAISFVYAKTKSDIYVRTAVVALPNIMTFGGGTDYYATLHNADNIISILELHRSNLLAQVDVIADLKDKPGFFKLVIKSSKKQDVLDTQDAIIKFLNTNKAANQKTKEFEQIYNDSIKNLSSQLITNEKNKNMSERDKYYHSMSLERIAAYKFCIANIPRFEIGEYCDSIEKVNIFKFIFFGSILSFMIILIVLRFMYRAKDIDVIQ